MTAQTKNQKTEHTFKENTTIWLRKDALTSGQCTCVHVFTWYGKMCEGELIMDS